MRALFNILILILLAAFCTGCTITIGPFEGFDDEKKSVLPEPGFAPHLRVRVEYALEIDGKSVESTP